tara:strand:- start:2402 stop:2953 length:552 start_codon:yes stop_codon:yes gene_type:complete
MEKEKEINLIKEEIRIWSKEVLEIPESRFGGLPPCPYARQAWAKNKVRVHVVSDLGDCLTIKDMCPDDDSLDVVAWTGYESMSADDFDTWQDEQNEKHSGKWLLGFHPDHPEDEDAGEFVGNDAPEYGIILIQGLTHLSKVSNTLFNRGYYNSYPKSEIKLIKRRNELCHQKEKEKLSKRKNP